MNVFKLLLDSVANHGSGESGVDLGSNSVKDELMHSPVGSLASSTFSESLSHFTGGQSSYNSSSLPFVCEQCGLTFTQRDELEKHEIASHPTNQVCVCFFTPYTLQKYFFIE